jgi:hypothetical protein
MALFETWNAEKRGKLNCRLTLSVPQIALDHDSKALNKSGESC